MGGKALKTVETRRYSKSEFVLANTTIYLDLRGLTLDFNYSPKISTIPHLLEKEDFGDLDILIGYKDPSDINKWIDKIVEFYKPQEYFKNGSVFTFNYNDLQVDLIFVKDKDFLMARTYFSWNDAGLLIGRIAHSLGLKYGDTGLHFYIYSDDKSQRLEHIILTNSPVKILKLLGFDYFRYRKGFNNYDELFEFIATSKYFSVNVFDSNLIRANDRRRDEKRKSIHLFRNFLSLNSERFRQSLERFTFEQRIEFINEHFPKLNIEKRIRMINYKYLLNKSISEKWNGNVIMERFPNLSGKELGFVMNSFKETKVKWNYYIEKTHIEKIFSDFNKHLKKSKKDEN